MPISTRITSIGKDITAFLDEALSPKAQSEALAGFAREELSKAQQRNKQALGRVPDHTTAVDGKSEAPLETVKPNGVIVFEFELVLEALLWIAAQLRQHSPERSGRYARSHILLADGFEVDVGEPPPAHSYEFVSTVPYARKIERGLSELAPDGVYEVVAALAQRRFGNQARVDFTYASVGGERQPAIVVTPR
jgi:hypothetical protein